MEVDKIDLSLDDIIKLNRKEKQQNRGQNAGQSRGGRGRGGRGQSRGRRGQSAGDRGQGRGVRGRGMGGRGRGNVSSRGGRLNTGRVFRRGGAITATRGRKPYTQGSTNPLLREVDDSPGKPRGRGRGSRGRAGLTRGRGSLRGRVGAKSSLRMGQLRKQNGTVGLTSLNRRRQQAIDSLLKAKQTLARLNSRQKQQQTNRSLLVNQRRGLQTSTSNLSTNRRGRGSPRGGRGRGLSGRGLSRYSSTTSIASVGSQRQGRGRGRGRGLLNRSISNSIVSINNAGKNTQNRRRRWRKNSASQDSSLLTVSVQNSPPKVPQRKNTLPRYNVGNDSDPSLQAQIKSLKPAVSTKYNFKKSVFSQASTSTSLNERFSSSSSSSSPAGKTDILGRKVFF